jgi:hypothetical protein
MSNEAQENLKKVSNQNKLLPGYPNNENLRTYVNEKAPR